MAHFEILPIALPCQSMESPLAWLINTPELKCHIWLWCISLKHVFTLTYFIWSLSCLINILWEMNRKQEQWTPEHSFLSPPLVTQSTIMSKMLSVPVKAGVPAVLVRRASAPSNSLLTPRSAIFTCIDEVTKLSSGHDHMSQMFLPLHCLPAVGCSV